MKCPFCGHMDDRVLETRIQSEGESIRRRRECLKCLERFTTHESLILQYPLVVKKDGRREQFSKHKVLQGIQLACQKRSVARSRIEIAADAVAKWALKCGQREVPVALIGSQVLRQLKDIDHMAFIRFASVHRTYNDLTDFLQHLETEEAAAAPERNS